MRCSDVEAFWDEMREGVEPRSEHVLAHLRRCRTCQEAFEQCEGVAYCLTCLPAVEPPKNLVPRILEHIASVRHRNRPAGGTDEFARLASPVGDLVVAWRGTGITFLGIDRANDPAGARAMVERRLRRVLRDAAPPEWVVEAVGHFFKTWQVDMSRVDISNLTDFEQAALRKAAQIPPGEVRSYGWIAREIGHPQSARAVGQAMARNPVALLFPCHRVVDASGGLHNYGYGVEVKARLLHMEGYTSDAPRSRPDGAHR